MLAIKFIESTTMYPDCPVEHIKDLLRALGWEDDPLSVTDKKEYWENADKTDYLNIPIKAVLPVGVVEAILAKVNKTIFDLEFYRDFQ